MGGKYICHYLSDEEIECGGGNGCIRPTASKYGYCNLHVNKCQSKEKYHRKKLDKMSQNWETLEMLGEALDRMKMPNAIGWP
ncbi:hypothetical protein GLOIN_2v1786063 [Rhizophagus clarus]|uniref:Uncharacterized protein n=1 Tax=Rhizophagus clarus TaxID=94130 RepID=A0A8H3LXJ7_9GLOM|nr:hypothetical protein GLOIN_2v1786063 [Rhizophagus clarus]